MEIEMTQPKHVKRIIELYSQGDSTEEIQTKMLLEDFRGVDSKSINNLIDEWVVLYT